MHLRLPGFTYSAKKQEIQYIYLSNQQLAEVDY